MSNPPSFSSFPDLTVKKPPPSFNSFPTTSSTSTSSSKLDGEQYTNDQSRAKGSTSSSSRKRSTNDFLDQIATELISTSSKRKGKSRASDKDQDRSERKREKERDNVKRSKGKEIEATTTTTSSERRVFAVDTKGDDFNLQYGGLYKGDIPRHRRIGAGRVVGLNSGLRITKESAYTGRGLEVIAHSNYRVRSFTSINWPV